MRYIIILTFLATSYLAKGEFFIRYNHLGYAPSSTKRIVIVSDENLKGTSWTLQVGDKLISNGTLGASYIGKGGHTSHSYNYLVTLNEAKELGEYQFKLKGKSIDFKVSMKPYEDVAQEVLRYLRVQRSGSKATLDHPISHLGDTSSIIKRKGQTNEDWKKDSKQKAINVAGGWYDAGDYLKFTLTCSYTTFLLLKAYKENPELFSYNKYSKSEHNDLLDEAKWGLDYLMTISDDSTEFIIQVGDAEDHNQGDRLPNEDLLDGKRHAYSSFSSTQMGYTIATLAKGSEVFAKYSFSNNYKNRAIELYNKKTKEVSWVKEGWEVFYADNSFADNMELAAVSLYDLTKDEKYLKDAVKFAHQAKSSYWSAWSSVNMYAHNLLYKHSKHVTPYLMEDLNNFSSIADKENNIWGIGHEYTWATLYSLLGVANNALLFDENRNSNRYHYLANNILDYTFGLNNWGISMVALKSDSESIKNVYSQVYKLQPNKYPSGAVAEGPGDKKTHEELKQYFQIPEFNKFDKFNADGVVFYDINTNFQTMETTITGLGEMVLLMALINK